MKCGKCTAAAVPGRRMCRKCLRRDADRGTARAAAMKARSDAALAIGVRICSRCGEDVEDGSTARRCAGCRTVAARRLAAGETGIDLTPHVQPLLERIWSQP